MGRKFRTRYTPAQAKKKKSSMARQARKQMNKHYKRKLKSVGKKRK